MADTGSLSQIGASGLLQVGEEKERRKEAEIAKQGERGKEAHDKTCL